MLDIQIISTAADALLLITLVYLCFKIVRTPNLAGSSREMQALEGSLRTLISEADQSGRSLNDQLRRRQNELEKLLADLTGAETRASKIVDAAESRSKSMEAQASRIEKLISESRTIEGVRANNLEQVREASQIAPTRAASALVPEVQVSDDFGPEPPSFSLTQTGAEAKRRPTKADPSVNIYGEQIGVAAELAAAESEEGYSPLSARVEKSAVSHAAAPAPQVIAEGIDDIYAAAENMLRAGHDLIQVASVTDLPIEDLRLLAQAVRRESSAQQAKQIRPQSAPRVNEVEVQTVPEKAARAKTVAAEVVPAKAVAEQVLPAEPEESPASASDPRLGVLGGIRRQVQVI